MGGGPHDTPLRSLGVGSRSPRRAQNGSQRVLHDAAEISGWVRGPYRGAPSIAGAAPSRRWAPRCGPLILSNFRSPFIFPLNFKAGLRCLWENSSAFAGGSAFFAEALFEVLQIVCDGRSVVRLGGLCPCLSLPSVLPVGHGTYAATRLLKVEMLCSFKLSERNHESESLVAGDF